jgi:hypothetical protein
MNESAGALKLHGNVSRIADKGSNLGSRVKHVSREPVFYTMFGNGSRFNQNLCAWGTGSRAAPAAFPKKYG